jgi:hypothetical protein
VFLKKYGRCPVKGCKRPADEKNHVLEDRHEGGPLLIGVCGEHHYWYTRANRHLASKQGFQVTAEQRTSNWSKLVKGKMKKPPITEADLRWRAKWPGRAAR